MIFRRPLVLLFLVYMLGIGSNYIFSPPKIIYVVLTLVLLALVLSMLFFVKRTWDRFNLSKKTMLFIMICLILFNIGGFVCETELTKEDPLWEYEESRIGYSGTCVKYQKKQEDFHKITVKNGRNKYLIHVFGEMSDPRRVVGSKMEFTGEVGKPSERRNPGCFDYRLYLKTIGIRSVISCDKKDVIFTAPEIKTDPLNWVYRELTDIKYSFLDRIKKDISVESFGLINGILFGSKENIDEDTYEEFQKNGIAHILSVSGIHVGIVYGFIYMIMRKKIITPTAVIIFIFLFIYAFLSEFSPSVVRAVLMISIHIVSKLLKKRYDLLTGTSLAALIMLIYNPLNLFHVGFQLSFLAVMLLAFMIPLIKRYVGKIRIIGAYKERFKTSGSDNVKGLGFSNPYSKGDSGKLKLKILDNLIPLAIIQIGMAPFSMYVFNHFSVAGLFMNIPIIFLAGIIIPLGIILFFISIVGFGSIGDIIFFTGAETLDFVLSLMADINAVISSLKFSSIQVVSPAPWILAITYGIGFFFGSETFRILGTRKMNRKIILITVLIISLGFGSSFTDAFVRNKSEVTFVDVGQGDCIHVKTESGKNILIDGGGSQEYDVGKKTLLPYFLKNGVSKLDYVFVTHLHTDHFQGIKELSRNMDIGYLIVFDGNKIHPENITKGSGIEKNNITYVGKGDHVDIETDIYMEILYPEKKNLNDYISDSGYKEDENKNSLFMKLNYMDASILITGDLDEKGEQQIINYMKASGKNPKKHLKSTVLKVGHHGSKYSTSDEFLEYVDPKFAVIQVGKNNYGHPAPEVIEKLNNRDIMIYRNDTCGAVMGDYEAGGLNFTEMIPRNK